VGKIAIEIDVSRSLVQTNLKNDLKLKSYNKVHGLTEAQKATWVQKCRQLHAWHAGDDNKLFLLQETHYKQNDWAYAVLLKDILQEKLTSRLKSS
jgi:hypothetical protein